MQKSGDRTSEASVMEVEGWSLVGFMVDGTRRTMKVVCAVWIGGKGGDNFKVLPIDINMESP